MNQCNVLKEKIEEINKVEDSRIACKDRKIEKIDKELAATKEKCNIKLIIVNTMKKLL